MCFPLAFKSAAPVQSVWACTVAEEYQEANIRYVDVVEANEQYIAVGTSLTSPQKASHLPWYQACSGFEHM